MVCGEAASEGWVQGAGCAGRREGRRPGGGAADTGGARVFRRSRNGLRPVCLRFAGIFGGDGPAKGV